MERPTRTENNQLRSESGQLRALANQCKSISYPPLYPTTTTEQKMVGTTRTERGLDKATAKKWKRID